MKQDADNSETWIGKTEKRHLRTARFFIDKLDMLTDLCVVRANRFIDLDDGKKKKKNDDGDEEEAEAEESGFLNLTELVADWDNEDPRVCNDEELNDIKNQ